MNEEMMELLMQSAMELMEPTRTRLREQNPVFEAEVYAANWKRSLMRQWKPSGM